jgi:hypothetical protein
MVKAPIGSFKRLNRNRSLKNITMKTRAITVAIILGGFSAAISQEYDDVYFKKSDRNKSSETVVLAKATKTVSTVEQTATTSQYNSVVLPEGYSGRTINPDYQPGGAAVVTTNSSYFKPNYQPTNVNGQLNQYDSYASNSNYYNSYRNGYGYGNYGGYYSPYNSYGYSPYGYGFGSCYTCMGGYSGWGYPSYYGYGSSLGFAMGYGSGYYGGYYGYGGGYYGGYYPTTVVVVNNPDSHVNTVYGKRQSRSTSYAGTASGRGTALVSDPTQGGRSGRVASNSTSNTYYQRGWRQDPAVNQSGGTSSSSSRSSVFNNSSSGSRSSWGSSGGTTTRPSSSWGNSTFSGGSRSSGSSFPSGGGSSFGGSRSSGGSSFGGGGGSRPSGGGSRGRN